MLSGGDIYLVSNLGWEAGVQFLVPGVELGTTAVTVNINTINDHAEPAAPAVSAAAARTIPKNQGRKNPPNAPPPL